MGTQVTRIVDFAIDGAPYKVTVDYTTESVDGRELTLASLAAVIAAIDTVGQSLGAVLPEIATDDWDALALEAIRREVLSMIDRRKEHELRFVVNSAKVEER